jgi:hypothetical protein
MMCFLMLAGAGAQLRSAQFSFVRADCSARSRSLFNRLYKDTLHSHILCIPQRSVLLFMASFALDFGQRNFSCARNLAYALRS